MHRDQPVANCSEHNSAPPYSNSTHPASYIYVEPNPANCSLSGKHEHFRSMFTAKAMKNPEEQFVPPPHGKARGYSPSYITQAYAPHMSPHTGSGIHPVVYGSGALKQRPKRRYENRSGFDACMHICGKVTHVGTAVFQEVCRAINDSINSWARPVYVPIA